jgi:diguanylate cyclase (GGDEF)-like protein/putative nucleotidyltransferase with HDIG domain
MARHLTPSAAPQSDQRLAQAVERLGRLPVLSATVRRVQVIAESEDAGIGDMVAALEADQGLAADLLRYANSAACARPLRARSIRAAVTLVGRKTIAQLAVEAATFRFFQRAPGNGGRSIGHLHLHAAAVAGTAQGIAERTGASTDIAHLGGLLHDVGKLVMPLAFGDEALDSIAAEHPGGASRAGAERRLLGVDHAEAGALVARASQIEAPVEQVIAFHHGGPSGIGIASPEAACVIIADEVVGLASRPEPDYALLGPALEKLGLCDEDFDDLALEAVRGGKGGAAMAAKVAELERQARVDDLTGVLNRRHWMATVRRAVADREPGSVLICDIDHFKAVNDGHGHATGDLVLTEVARTLSSQGVVGRLGGDEFAVWVPGGPRRGDEAASAVLDSVAAAFAGEHPGLRVGVSIGTASPGDDADHLSYPAEVRRRRRNASVNRRDTAGSEPSSHSVTTTSSPRGTSWMQT